MANNAGRLKLVGHISLDFEVYELEELDDTARQALNADPFTVMRGYIEDTGQAVNGMYMDEIMLKASPDGGAPPPPTQWHCESPGPHFSKWISIVIQ